MTKNIKQDWTFPEDFVITGNCGGQWIECRHCSQRIMLYEATLAEATYFAQGHYKDCSKWPE